MPLLWPSSVSPDCFVAACLLPPSVRFSPRGGPQAHDPGPTPRAAPFCGLTCSSVWVLSHHCHIMNKRSVRHAARMRCNASVRLLFAGSLRGCSWHCAAVGTHRDCYASSRARWTQGCTRRDRTTAPRRKVRSSRSSSRRPLRAERSPRVPWLLRMPELGARLRLPRSSQVRRRRSSRTNAALRARRRNLSKT